MLRHKGNYKRKLVDKKSTVLNFIGTVDFLIRQISLFILRVGNLHFIIWQLQFFGDCFFIVVKIAPCIRGPPPLILESKSKSKENRMREFQKSNYAVNKFKEGIVYHFLNGERVEVSMDDYLSENPEKSPEDFLELKKYSDQIYYEQVLEETRYERHRCSVGKLEETEKMTTPSLYIEFIKKEERKDIQFAIKELLRKSKLTEIQKRRFLLHFIEGFSYREIAEIEQIHFTSVQESIGSCIKKIKKIYLNL